MADYENMELTNVEMEENDIPEEGSATSNLLLAGAGLALVGLGYGIKTGIDKLKEHRAAKKTSEEPKKEKKIPFWKRKKKEEPKSEEKPAAPVEENKAETEKEKP